MTDATASQARAEAILGELAELGLMLARDLATQARACEDPADTERLVTAFNKTSRAVRLTLALEAKLRRDRARESREETQARRRVEAEDHKAALDQAIAQRGHTSPSPAQRHKARVAGLLNRLIWNESEGDQEDYEVLRDDLSTRLDEAALCEGFLETPVVALAQAIGSDMGLTGTMALTLGETVRTVAATTPRPAEADTG
jgi:hypothetical protein